MNYKQIIKYCVKVIIMDILIVFSVWTTIYFQMNNDNNMDIDKCYLTIQNFVTMRHGFNISNDRKFDLKTYISSFSKPYLIELLQHETKDCLCAQ